MLVRYSSTFDPKPEESVKTISIFEHPMNVDAQSWSNRIRDCYGIPCFEQDADRR